MGEWLDDAFGPDGVRVSLCVEPAVARLVRERDAWTTPHYGWFPSPGRNTLRDALPGLLQSWVFKDRWVVVIEADSGQRRRLTRANREEALGAAQAARERLVAEGVPAIAELT